jgi:hypothetical protein
MLVRTSSIFTPPMGGVAPRRTAPCPNRTVEVTVRRMESPRANLESSDGSSTFWETNVTVAR